MPTIILAGTLRQDEEDEARAWLNGYSSSTIPRNLCETSFSRSSGPGGQNVNRTNSKATLRISLKDLLPLVPGILHQSIRDSRYYASSSDALVIQADSNRKQGDNVEQCFAKLEDLIKSAARQTIPGETSVEQAEKVKKLQRRSDSARRKMKSTHSSKKSARRGGGPGF
ncbi:hypothetical protein MMC25_003658 [Agyrium rufum]|nr:hypothetical protein [Agyrium rufum]